mmetsp:Transcript_21819/g.70442  ORF Transcript_21819/g.70442 Transcript_21819/m.70442 type:complete len:349 (-) Transcript_21819:168-1214(-)
MGSELPTPLWVRRVLLLLSLRGGARGPAQGSLLRSGRGWGARARRGEARQRAHALGGGRGSPARHPQRHPRTRRPPRTHPRGTHAQRRSLRQSHPQPPAQTVRRFMTTTHVMLYKHVRELSVIRSPSRFFERQRRPHPLERSSDERRRRQPHPRGPERHFRRRCPLPLPVRVEQRRRKRLHRRKGRVFESRGDARLEPDAAATTLVRGETDVRGDLSDARGAALLPASLPAQPLVRGDEHVCSCAQGPPSEDRRAPLLKVHLPQPSVFVVARRAGGVGGCHALLDGSLASIRAHPSCVRSGTSQRIAHNYDVPNPERKSVDAPVRLVHSRLLFLLHKIEVDESRKSLL